MGYAVAHLQDGPDDTFAVGARYAELYSLSARLVPVELVLWRFGAPGNDESRPVGGS